MDRRDIAEALMQHGKARGAACVVEAEQLCLLLGRRGDERVVTQAFTGYAESAQSRNEFPARAIGGGRRARIDYPTSVKAQRRGQRGQPVDSTSALATGPSSTLNCRDMR